MSNWRPIESAPKDGTPFDVWAKRWICASDTFTFMRFTDCRWRERDAMGGRVKEIVGISDGWHPTHWMPHPPPPARED